MFIIGCCLYVFVSFVYVLFILCIFLGLVGEGVAYGGGMVWGLNVIGMLAGFIGVFGWNSTRIGDLAICAFFTFFCVVVLVGLIEVIGVLAEFGTRGSFVADTSKFTLG